MHTLPLAIGAVGIASGRVAAGAGHDDREDRYRRRHDILDKCANRCAASIGAVAQPARTTPGLSARGSSRPSRTCTVAAAIFAFIPIAVTAFIIATAAKPATIVVARLANADTSNPVAALDGARRERRSRRGGALVTPRAQ